MRFELFLLRRHVHIFQFCRFVHFNQRRTNRKEQCSLWTLQQNFSAAKMESFMIQVYKLQMDFYCEILSERTKKSTAVVESAKSVSNYHTNNLINVFFPCSLEQTNWLIFEAEKVISQPPVYQIIHSHRFIFDTSYLFSTFDLCYDSHSRMNVCVCVNES